MSLPLPTFSASSTDHDLIKEEGTGDNITEAKKNAAKEAIPEMIEKEWVQADVFEPET